MSTSSGGDVEVRFYLTQLCQSLGASMIADPDRLSIQVAVDNSRVGPDVSVSLGLIVTELVINALKHAFPDEMTGTIAVDYRSSGGDSPLIRMGAVELVVSAGYEAIEASDAEEAIRILESRDDIDLVFTDVQMPGTMDGTSSFRTTFETVGRR